MSRLIRNISILLVCVAVSFQIDAKTSTALRRERSRAEQRAKAAEQRLEANRKALRSNLNELNSLQADISNLDAQLQGLKANADSLSRRMAPLSDSISLLTDRLEAMRIAYARVLRKTYRNSTNLDELTFIFSSSTFSEALRRLQSLKQFARWRTRKSEELTSTMTLLDTKKQRLDSLSQANARILAQTESSRRTQEEKRRNTDLLVKQLEASSVELEKEVTRRNNEMAELDSHIEQAMAEERQRQIEEERKKAEAAKRKTESKPVAEIGPVQDGQPTKSDKSESTTTEQKTSPNVTNPPSQQAKPVQMTPEEQKRISGQFETQKGKLSAPFKGNGKIVKKFGRQKHPRLANVTTDNAGIDIETSKGATVVAVFDGEVSQIFKLGGYNNVIVIRHGDYVTVYANLVDLKVVKGDRVKRGVELGKVYVDASDNNRSVLHFELRREKEKQDPEKWLKKF